jgi:hypothetical protein
MSQPIVMALVEMMFRGKAKLDAAGNKVLGEDKKPVIIKERQNFKVQLPLLTRDGAVEILTTGNDKSVDAALKAMNSLIYAQAKRQVDENETIDSQEGIDLSKLSWDYIASLSASELSESAAPSKEVLEALAADYVSVMPTLVGISVELAKAGAAHFTSKFRNIKLRDDMLGKLSTRLTTWFEATDKAEEFAEAYDWLQTKAANYIEEAQKSATAEFC